MWLISAIWPVILVGGIVVFVIKRLEHKYKHGKLGKKKLNEAQILLDSFIPIGMLIGCIIGLIFGMFFPDYSLLTMSLGSGIGYLLGFFAYEIYSKPGNNFS
ncbi:MULTISPECIES: hypothetical protein [Bacillus]|uniref:Group-specific protein n=2 Tax=Bacillus anthracis TaxID=1392 RepID=A0AAC8NA69_BACAN|nr:MULTISPECIES: hypothetical protein [Bacillus]EJT22366.1 hypothetical protein B353_03552 [Bacillus anthracis str. UR-1]EXJ21507.1 hypothetical protein Y693_05355 [Bacillus anthracis str. 95014]AAP24990.1 hypothetical protein BA_1003 [Bacillus anthracis str. Ames]AAT30106.1 hypothetical protein GBAA_1003 [Bacillus anthracis str. 'Ames Ancestor']AAT53263.1 hypothetical protein BAS0938 [Bacillus anthracis str. Sterne]